MSHNSGLQTSHGHWPAAGPPPAEGSRAQGEELFPRLAGEPGERVCSKMLLPGALSVTYHSHQLSPTERCPPHNCSEEKAGSGWTEIKGTILAKHFPGAMPLLRLAFSSMLHLGRPVGTEGVPEISTPESVTSFGEIIKILQECQGTQGVLPECKAI